MSLTSTYILIHIYPVCECNCYTEHARNSIFSVVLAAISLCFCISFLCFYVSGEVPCVWPEWYLPGCRRLWHPCLHLQAVVWGPQLHRWGQKKCLFSNVHPVCMWYGVLLCGGVRFVTLLVLSNCRPYRIGDWSGLWRERSVPDLCRNGQKSQILQFVDKG